MVQHFRKGQRGRGSYHGFYSEESGVPVPVCDSVRRLYFGILQIGEYDTVYPDKKPGKMGNSKNRNALCARFGIYGAVVAV